MSSLNSGAQAPSAPLRNQYGSESVSAPAATPDESVARHLRKRPASKADEMDSESTRKSHAVDLESPEANLGDGEDVGGVNASLLSRDEREHQEQDPLLRPELHICRMLGIFSFSFTNGTLLSTYLLATLPTEAERMDEGLKSIILGTFIGLAGVTQLSGPIAGLLSDRCTSSFGKRRPFMLAGGLVGALGLVMQYIGSAAKDWTLYGAGFLIAMLALNVIFSSMIGLVPDLVPEQQMGRANGIIAMLSVLGAVSGFAMWFAVQGNLGDMYKFYLVLLVSTLYLTALTANERPVTKSIPPLRWQDIKDCFWVSPSEHHDFFMVFVSRTLYYCGISSSSFFKFYIKDMIGVSDPNVAVGVIAVIGQICGSLAAYPVGYLSDYLNNGRKIYIYISCAIMALVNLGYIFCYSVWPVYILSGVIGAANGAYLTMDYAIAVDTLPSKDEAARFMGVWGVGAFIGTALGPAIGGPLLYFAGATDTPGQFSRLGYALLQISSAVYLTLAAYLLKYVYGAR